LGSGHRVPHQGYGQFHVFIVICRIRTRWCFQATVAASAAAARTNLPLGTRISHGPATLDNASVAARAASVAKFGVGIDSDIAPAARAPSTTVFRPGIADGRRGPEITAVAAGSRSAFTRRRVSCNNKVGGNKKN